MVDVPPATREAGAAIVELALALPLLLLLLFGIIDFGRAYSTDVQLTGAAREAVRVLALGGTTSQAQAAASAAAPGLTPAPTATPTATCPASGAAGTARVDIAYTLPAVTPVVPSGSFTISTSASMRCTR